MTAKKKSARDKLRAYFEANVGKVLNTQDLSRVAEISEYARRIRELRDEEGMRIRTHYDMEGLKPGEYLLESIARYPAFGRRISPQLRYEILERNGFTCQLCGAGANDPDPFNPNRKLRLHIDHEDPISHGEIGAEEKDKLRVLCSACNQARSNIKTPTESAKNLLARIRRSPRSVQREVYEALKRSFEVKQKPNKK